MQVKLPRLGEGADTGTVATIFVKEGDVVKKDQPVLELESEKAVASIPSPASGRVEKIHVKEGDEVKVGQLIFTLADEGREPAIRPHPAIDASVGNDEGAGALLETEPSQGPGPMSDEEEPAPVRSGSVPPASPSVRKVARELGIDLRQVRGSERGGRIVMADLKRYVQRLHQQTVQPKAVPAIAVQPVRATAESIDFSRWGAVRRKKMTTLRRTISSKMTESWTTVPHITQFDHADVSGILDLREKYKSTYERKGAHLTLTSFVLRAVVNVLKKYPMFNASIDEAAGEVVYKHYYHIGIAVDTEQGLIVPVIRDADKKNLLELSLELKQLAERTRQRTVPLEEMQGGSFTISNQGGIGGGHFTPIVNKPEVAILGLGRGGLTPVVRKGKVEERMMLPVSLSYDHRLIDGADAARFIVDLVRSLETFSETEVKI